jgi:hypothetical protein
MRILYRLLLHLHPPAFRERYGEEMLWIFDQTAGGLKTARLLGDAAISLIRQRLLRRDQNDADSRGMALVGSAPMFLIPAGALPTGRILFSGALCSLLMFSAMGSVIARGGRRGFSAVPRAEAVRSTSLSFLALAAPPQQPEPADEPGSISGRVVDAVTGQPVIGAHVMAIGRAVRLETTTDAQGRYRFDDAPTNTRGVLITPLGSNGLAGMMPVSLESGEDLKSVDFRLYPNPSVSGVVTDPNGEPLEGIEVTFLRREYGLGGIRYVRTGLTRTNDLGEYRLERSSTIGTAPALLWARRPQMPLPAISDTPVDPALRRLAIESTYFPNGVRPEEGAVIRLAPGEQRENINIQLRSSPSFCVEAQAHLAGAATETRFLIDTTEPALGAGRSNALFSPAVPGQVGPDGRLRICDLARGEYRLMVLPGASGAPEAQGVAVFSITDEDVKNVQVTVQPRTPLPGKTLWAATPPPEPVDQEIRIELWRSNYGSGGPISTQSQVPGEFQIKWNLSIGRDPVDPLMDQYRVGVEGLPSNVYVKDVTYGGESVWHKSLYLGSKPAGVGLEVILAHDGGTLHAHVADDKGEPAGDATVVLIPKTAATHMELADTRLTGMTNNKGEAALRNIPPGEYWVLATDDNFMDYAVETIAALFDSRSKAEEINVGPNATIDIELEVRRLER